MIEVVKALWQVLPRLALIWAFTLALFVLGIGAMRHRTREHVTALDAAWQLRLRKWRYSLHDTREGERMALHWFFRFFTNFASAPCLCVLSVALPYYALHRVSMDTGPIRLNGLIGLVGAWLFPGMCYLGAMLLAHVMKKIFKRVRPPREEKAFGHRAKDASFPSGHSLTAFAFWFGIALVLFETYGLRQHSVPFVFVAATVVACTGLSRVFLGVHYPSDVLGGYVIGIVWCALCFWALHSVLPPVFL